MNVKKQIRKVADLDITGFETLRDANCAQQDMLSRFERSSLDPGRYCGLADCRSDYCAYKNCLEACWFGTRRRRIREIQAVHKLLSQCDGPFYEVRLIRGSWALPIGQLRRTNITAAKKLNARALDKLFLPDLIAVGMFKVYAAPRFIRPLWVCEIQQIIVGAPRHELQKTLSSGREGMAMSNKLWIGEVRSLGQTINRVFRRDVQGWQNFEKESAVAPDPTKRQRREFYNWLLDLRPGARLIRYGCDQYFTKLTKQPRPFRVTVRRERPYPYHLKKYMFGAREEYGEDKYDPEEVADPFETLKWWRHRHNQ
jgi:hypothetical protein